MIRYEKMWREDQFGRLKTVFIPNPTGKADEKFGKLVAWCPWCEGLHYHGAGGRGAEPRIEACGANCTSLSGSPFIGRGYELDVIGMASSDLEALPDAPMLRLVRRGEVAEGRQKRLKTLLKTAAPAIARDLARSTLGFRLYDDDENFDVANLPAGQTAFNDFGSPLVDREREIDLTWSLASPLSESSGTTTFGIGPATLLSHAFGLPLSIVLVRLLEAVSGIRFGSSTREKLALVLADWWNGRHR